MIIYNFINFYRLSILTLLITAVGLQILRTDHLIMVKRGQF